MPSKKPRRRRAKHNAWYTELPLVGVTTGVIFFSLQLLLLIYGPSYAGSFIGFFIGLWVLGGIAFVAGVVSAIRGSRSAPLLLAGPAISFVCFCLVSLVSNFGSAVAKVLVGY